MRDQVEMGHGERCGRRPRDRRGQHECRGTAQPARQTALEPAIAPGGKGCNQRRRGGKGHLETGAQQRFGREDQNDQRGNRHGSEGQGPPVEHHGEQHHGHHDEGALRRDIAPERAR